MGKPLKKKSALKVIGIIGGGIAGILLLLFLVLLVNSPGKISPYRDDNGDILAGSVADIIIRDVGGVEQGMILKGRSDENPVLLFLHGGPGNPEYVLAKEADVGLEEVFTVCWWEQRGSGMSYSSEPGPLTLEQMIEDTVEVTVYLMARFGEEKIYLMGHSWGTFLGMQTVAAHPELYHSFIGIGQISDQMRSEQLAYSYIQDSLKDKGDKKGLEKLRRHSLENHDDITADYLFLRSSFLSEMGNGVTRIPQSKLKLLLPIFAAHEYTLADKYGYAMGSLVSLESPANLSIYKSSLFEDIPKVSVPVYMFHGIHDMQVSYQLAKEYYQLLDAPLKRFYTFEKSAHSPFLEEPERFMEIVVRDVLGG